MNSLRAIIKSEFLKLFTVRSTYILVILSLLIVIALSFYFEGYRGITGSPTSELAPTALSELARNAAGMSIMFASIIAILFTAHEYRYNMISYTLTINSRRSKVLLGKLLTIVSFSVAYGLVTVLIALGGYLAGVALRDASLPPQDLELLPALGKVAFYYLGYALLGTIIAVIVRSVVGAIATLLLVSIMAEPLLSLLLKDNAKYLPITSLDSTIGVSEMIQNPLSVGAAMLVSSAYLAVGLVVAWVLFVRRDAS